jgi:FAD dependent oxidoreductase TIGR03364
MEQKSSVYDVIIIGSGIVGLALARALGERGKKILVLERNDFAVGASIRNFGMIWPIGQPDGELYERALLSKSIWKEVCDDAGIWYDPVGSLHLAYNKEEMDVLQDFYVATGVNRDYKMLDSSEARKRSTSIVSKNLQGGLYSTDEIIVDSPKAIRKIPDYLNEKYGVDFRWNTFVHYVETGKVHTGKAIFEAEEIYVSTGPDFETIFPHIFSEIPLTKCKLQMMRFESQPSNWRLGPALCGGLSLIHYSSFKSAGSSLQVLKKFYEDQYSQYLKWGIHVMVSQNQSGELVIGDSHEYGKSHDPFDKQFINDLILDYLSHFACFPSETISASWNGTYAKMTDGSTFFIHQPMQGVTILNGLGGLGMTFSFGLAEQLINGNL